jgi:hypothetical protein
MLRLFSHLGHPDAVTGRIKSIKGRTGLIELISEHEHKVAGHATLLYD